MIATFCDCLECGEYCQCKCHKPDHKEMTMAIHAKVMNAFDSFFDLVNEKKPIFREDFERLLLNEEGVVKIHDFIFDRGYRPDGKGALRIP